MHTNLILLRVIRKISELSMWDVKGLPCRNLWILGRVRHGELLNADYRIKIVQLIQYSISLLLQNGTSFFSIKMFLQTTALSSYSCVQSHGVLFYYICKTYLGTTYYLFKDFLKTSIIYFINLMFSGSQPRPSLPGTLM